MTDVLIQAPREVSINESIVSSIQMPDHSVDQAFPTSVKVATITIAIICVVGALQLGAPFFIPVVISIFLSYALAPIVRLMTLIKIPSVLGALIVVLGMVSVTSYAIYRFGNEVTTILQQLPEAVEKVKGVIQNAKRDKGSVLNKVEYATQNLDSISIQRNTSLSKAPLSPVFPNNGLDPQTLLLSGSTRAISAAAQLISVLFLTYFLLAAGDMFRRKLVRLVGPALSKKKIAVQILVTINQQIQRYFAIVAITNVCVGIGVWLAFLLLGVEYSLVWGIAAGLLHTIPYFGPGILASAAALATLVQSESVEQAMLVGGAALVVVTLIGMGLQTWLIGRAVKLNGTAIFISLLFWALLWGGWGLFLGVPIMMAIKTICEHIKGAASFAELLSSEDVN